MEQTKPTYEELEARLTEIQSRLEQAQQRVSDLRAAPEEAKSQSALDALMDYIPEGITIADRNTQMILMESRYGFDLEQESYQQEQVPLREGLAGMGMRRPDAESPVDVEELPLWRATMNGETVKGEEWVLVGRRKEPVTLMINAGPIRDSLGRITGGIDAWRDVTTRKELETELRRREEQFFNIFNINPDPIVIACIETGKFMDVNGAFVRKTGYSREEALQMDIERLWKYPESYHEFRNIIRRDGECYDFEATTVTKSGEVRYRMLGAKRLSFGGRDAILVVSHDITDRKRAEEALRQNEQLLTNVLDSLPVGVFVIDRNGRVARVNPAAERIWGGAKYVSIDESDQYKAWWADTGKRIEAADWAGVRAVTLGETSINEEILIEGFDGTRRYISNSAMPIKDDSGEIAGAIAVVEDITTRYEAQLALRQSEEKYRELVETASVLIVRTDLDGHLTFLNDYAQKFFETDEAAIGTYALDLFTFRDETGRQTTIEQATAIIRGHADVPFFEVEALNKKGELVWVDWSIRAIFDAEGNMREMLGVGLDVTERKRAEEALRQNEQRFRTLLEALPTLVWTLMPDGSVEYVNQKWVEYMGMSPDEGPQWMEAVHPEDRQQTVESVRRTIEQGESYEVEYRLRRHDGVYRWHLSRALPLRDNNGNIFRWFGTSTDIHDHKMIEQDLRRTAAELERSNKELEEFAYVASHDLQEPLRMVTGYLQLIERRYKGKLDDDADEFIAFAVDAATRMQRLIADLLAYSRVSTRGHPLVSTDSNQAFERARADLWSTIVETGTKLTNDPLPIVEGDETQLAQLFLNLIGNAIKFRSEKTPEIHVGAKPEKDAYLFYVRDNGIGLDEKYAARIFQVFQRLHTRQKYPGTGIGLAICKKIVDRHGGRIWVESEPGKGSTFYFTLPKAGGES